MTTPLDVSAGATLIFSPRGFHTAAIPPAALFIATRGYVSVWQPESSGYAVGYIDGYAAGLAVSNPVGSPMTQAQFRRAGATFANILKASADPTAEANRVILYSKDDGGVAQFFVRVDDGTIFQLTPPALPGGFTVQPPSTGDFTAEPAKIYQLEFVAKSNTATLPPASDGDTQVIGFKRLDAAATWAIEQDGADTIDGSAAVYSFNGDQQYLLLASDGVSNWIIMSKVEPAPYPAVNSIHAGATYHNLLIADAPTNGAPQILTMTPTVNPTPFTGIEAGSSFDNRMVYIYNAHATNNLELLDQNVGSTGNNQFLLPSATYILGPLEGCLVRYRFAPNKWTLIDK